jgi:hypothetical protein
LLTDYTVDLWIDPLALTDLNTFIIGQEDSWKLTLDGTSSKYLKFSAAGVSSLDKRIAASTDDCVYEQKYAATDLFVTNSNIYAGGFDNDYNREGAGLRFTGINIPKNAVITNAYLTFVDKYGRQTGVCNTRIAGEAVDNPATFSTKENFISRKSNQTSAVVDWDGTWTDAPESVHNSPNISSVVQELVNRSGWNSGNSMVLFWNDFDNRSLYPSGPGNRLPYSYDNSTTKAPLLHVEYVTPSAVSVIAPIALTLEAWNHIAIVQSSGTIKLYVNGVLGASVAGNAIVNGVEDLTIGADSNGEHLFDGFIEEVRVSKGIARWTAAFTPPAVEYSSDSYTKLLLPLNVQTVPNMVLQSVGYVSNYVPTSARVVIFEEDIDVMEQNVDLKIEVSRDGGTTFTTCLIAKDQEFGDGTLNLFSGSVDLQGQPNGELLVWKLTTQNNKDCRIRGVSLSWR